MRANAFLKRGLGDADDRCSAVAEAAARQLAPSVYAELVAQNRALPPSAARDANVEALATTGCALVVTGQQMGLFLGPLYTLHKAASAVALARQLTSETGTRCVPLFWLQTEDHDFAEIATALTPRRDGTTLRQTLVDETHDPRVSIAQRRVPESIVKLLDELDAELAGRPFALETSALLRQHYAPGASLVEAFAGVLATLFVDDGLVLFNPRNAATAVAAAPIVRRAIDEWQPIEACLSARVDALAAAGFTAPIQLRSRSPLPFFHVGDASGPRHRLLRADGTQWSLSGRAEQLADREIARLCTDEPLRFSASALLRPVIQDALFPVAAYVGGPAEVGYLAQLAPLYDYLDIKPSLVAPRAQLCLIPPVAKRALTALELPIGELDGPRAKALEAQHSDEAPSLAWAAELEARLANIAPDLARDLAPAIDRTRATIKLALERFAERYAHAATARRDSAQARLRRARGWLVPDGAPQERTLSFPAFAAEVGLATLKAKILAAIDPLSPSLREVDL